MKEDVKWEELASVVKQISGSCCDEKKTLFAAIWSHIDWQIVNDVSEELTASVF
jgi:hypothetical protein